MGAPATYDGAGSMTMHTSPSGAAGAIFRDGEREREFARDGFTVLPLLSAEAAAAALARLDVLVRKYRRGIAGRLCHMSYVDPDPAYRKAADAFVRDAIAGPLHRAVAGYRTVSGGVFLKAAGAGEVAAHTDWTLTEDRAEVTFSVWCALADVDERNGALRIVPGSHRLSDNVAGIGIPPFFEAYVEQAKARSVAVPLRPGEAVAFDSRAIHWSPPNRTERPRPALQIVCLPERSRHVYYVPAGEGREARFELFAIADGANQDFTPAEVAGGARPGARLGFVRDDNRPLPQAAFERMLDRRSVP